LVSPNTCILARHQIAVDGTKLHHPTAVDRSIYHWVTSAHTVTDTIDGKQVTVEEMYDVRIENGKIKNIYVAAKAVITEE